jgi:hypothetical protein
MSHCLEARVVEAYPPPVAMLATAAVSPAALGRRVDGRSRAGVTSTTVCWRSEPLRTGLCEGNEVRGRESASLTRRGGVAYRPEPPRCRAEEFGYRRPCDRVVPDGRHAAGILPNPGRPSRAHRRHAQPRAALRGPQRPGCTGGGRSWAFSREVQPHSPFRRWSAARRPRIRRDVPLSHAGFRSKGSVRLVLDHTPRKRYRTRVGRGGCPSPSPRFRFRAA